MTSRLCTRCVTRYILLSLALLLDIFFFPSAQHAAPGAMEKLTQKYAPTKAIEQEQGDTRFLKFNEHQQTVHIFPRIGCMWSILYLLLRAHLRAGHIVKLNPDKSIFSQIHVQEGLADAIFCTLVLPLKQKWSSIFHRPHGNPSTFRSATAGDTTSCASSTACGCHHKSLAWPSLSYVMPPRFTIPRRHKRRHPVSS
jgi:hypothetical protein